MLLLVFVTIYIYRKFRELADEKGLGTTKWGLIGCFIYLGIGLGLPFCLGIFMALGVVNLDVEDNLVNIVLSIISYGLGGLGAYLMYRKLSSMPDSTEKLDIENFGKNEEEQK
ncbi:MAG TPA: hypothetical protein VNB90_11020 [Cytophagaceae bacterium]|nr:hypothetical protein [Cytophagaceae bacterium]